MSDEVRCPMCGKPNPAELEVCQFCHARLKPLRVSTAQDQAPVGKSQPVEPKDQASTTTDLPDWLQSLRQHQEPIPAGPETEQILPDWLSESLGEPEAPSGGEKEELPDWLSELRESSPVEDTGLSAEKSPGADWLLKTDTASVVEETEAVSPSKEEQDWLQSLRSRQEFDASSLTSEQEEDQLKKQGPLPSPTAETPDWMTDISSRKEAEETAPGPVKPTFEPDVPSEKGYIAPFTLNEESIAELKPLFEEEPPDWLKGITPLEKPSVTPAALLPEAGSVPVAAELPPWLEAMRPLETGTSGATVPGELDERVETAGPLSGIRGILPAEPDIAQVQKPPSYSIKLQVTDSHQASAALLAQMVKTEAEPRPLPSQPAIRSQQIMRIAIALLLILIVLLPLVTGKPQVRLPAFSSETGITNQLVNSLGAGDPVLLAFDYEPGLSGEMDATAASVLDHLMLKGVHLALISTSPTGPLLGERLIALVNQRGVHKYQLQKQYINLGFIPGGQAGLLSFAEAPRQLIPFALDGSRWWESGPIENITSLAGFRMVIVITESPDNARAWIEQVQPLMGGTPLVMVISAQAEPLIRPYYGGKPSQVQGIVTGLAGGASYENLNGRHGIARNYWNAFSAGLLGAGLLVLIAGIINAAYGFFKRDGAESKGEVEA